MELLFRTALAVSAFSTPSLALVNKLPADGRGAESLRPTLVSLWRHADDAFEGAARAVGGFIEGKNLSDGRSGIAEGFLKDIEPNLPYVPSVEDVKPVLPHVPSRREQMYFRKVSTSLLCVIFLTAQSLLVHTALAIARNHDELCARVEQPSLITDTLEVAARSNAFPPMLCIIFVACRLYVLSSTTGLGEPRAWIKNCMIMASLGTTLQFLLVLMLPFLVAADSSTGKEKPVRLSPLAGETCDAHPMRSFILKLRYVNGMAKCIGIGNQYLSIAMIYLGAMGVIVGTLMPSTGGTQPVSPAVTSTLVLAAVYFAVSLALWFARSQKEVPMMRGVDSCVHRPGGVQGAALSAAAAVRKAPMLAVLFLGARMRALQLDPPDGMPPLWGRAVFVCTTSALVLETFAAAYVGFSGVEERGYYGAYLYSASRTAHAIQHGFAAAVFIGTGITLLQIYIGHGRSDDPPLSPTMGSVVCLHLLFFCVMFVQWLAQFVQDVFKRGWSMLRDTFLAAGIAVNVCPLLCILFLGCRLRALQITQQKGDPPSWALGFMYGSVFAALVQVVCCLALPAFTGLATKVDKDGNALMDMTPMIGAYTVTVTKFVALFFLHGGVVAVSVACIVMTPETAVPGASVADYLENRDAIVKAVGITVVVLLTSLILSSAKIVGLVVKITIEQVAKPLLGVEVEVGSSVLAIFKGFVDVRNIKVKNPDGFSSPYLMKLDTLVVKLNVGLLIWSLGKKFEVTWLELTGLRLMFEKDFMDRDSTSNIQTVVDRLATDSHAGATASPNAKLDDKVSDDLATTAEKNPQKQSGKWGQRVHHFVKTAREKVKKQLTELRDKIDTAPKVFVYKLCIKDIGATIVTQHDGLERAVLSIDDIDFDNFYEHCGGDAANLSSTSKTVISDIMKTILHTSLANSGIIRELAKLYAEVAATRSSNYARHLGSMIISGRCCQRRA